MSAAVNQNFTDIATGLSDCLTRDGQAGMTAVFKAVSGSVSAPGISFNADATAGLYLSTTGIVGLVAKSLGLLVNSSIFQLSSATVQAGGSGYAVGDRITLTGGTFINAAVLTVATLSGSAVATVTVAYPGNYSVTPSNPVSQGSTTGSGTSATFNLTFAAQFASSIVTNEAGALPWQRLGSSSFVSGLMAQPTGFDFANAIGGSNITAVIGSSRSLFGFDAPINLQLNASVGSNILTVAVKANNGSDPTPTNPVLIAFRDTTIANGDPVWIPITGALSINTNATGATLGTQSSNVPFRFWVVAFNNAGTAVLALWHSGAGATAPVINPIPEWNLQNTTAISAAATSAGVFYTPNGTALTSCAFRIIGFLDYSSGLTTAGTYATAPTRVQLFGPGIKKPGDVVQTQFAASVTSLSISPSSTINLVRAVVTTDAIGTTPTTPFQSNMAVTLKRGSTTLQSRNIIVYGSSNAQQVQDAISWNYIDNPATTSSTSYNITGTGNFNNFANEAFELDEIMG